MALLKAGWFQTTWFPSRWWQEDWWLEYGIALPSAPIVGGGVIRVERKEDFFQRYPELLYLLQKYLEIKTERGVE